MGSIFPDNRIAAVGGWQYDLLERHVSWSDETCRIHGHAPGHRPSLDEAMSFFAPPARSVIHACIEKAIARGERFDVELPMIRVDGARIMVRCIGSVERVDGRAVRIVGAIQDVTEHAVRRLAEVEDSHRRLERAHERLSLASDGGGIGIWDFDVASGAFIWDERMFALYGLDATAGESADESVDGIAGRSMDGERWLAMVHPDDRQSVLDASRGAILGYGPYELRFRVTDGNGREREMHGTARVVRERDGRALRLVGTNRDVTEVQRTTRELARQHEILTVTLRSIGDGVVTTDTEGRVLWLNPVAEALLGRTTSEAGGRPLADICRLVDEGTRARAPDPVHRCLAENRITGLAGDTLLIARDGTRRWIEGSAAPIRRDDGEVFGAVLVVHDVTEQRSIANEMTWRATHDELTGLANRAELEATLVRVLGEARVGCADSRSTRDRAGGVLLFIDLDRFKIVNDSCGHAAGDRLLRQASRLLAHSVDQCDTLARIGGDEFAVVLRHCTSARAESLAREICALLDEYRFVHEGQRFRIGASIGLVPIEDTFDDVAAIIHAADCACYAAKDSGRNRVHRWCESDRALHERSAQMRWATRLETALDRDGFELYAQRIGPATSASGGSGDGVSGTPADPVDTHAEILLRLRGEDGVAVPPDAFLPAAERFNLIGRIDAWVLDRVVRWLDEHRGRIDVRTLWVNLSGQSFGDRRFQHETLVRLRTAGSELCSSLCLEITETAAVTDLAAAAVFIRRLRALGVHVALDDFGAGASSFGYLRSLPVDYLKIDGQFVRNLIEDPLDAAAVRCFAEIARLIEVRTVAESVETIEVLEHLREIGVDLVQGWLLHHPAPIAELLHRTRPTRVGACVT